MGGLNENLCSSCPCISQIRPEDGTVDALLNVMDACSIEKAVAFATFSNFLGPGDEEPNQALAKRIRNEDRLKGFGVIDFSREDLEDQVEAIYQLGFPGIKLHPAFSAFPHRWGKGLSGIRSGAETGSISDLPHRYPLAPHFGL